MASEPATAVMNGNYDSQPSYGTADKSGLSQTPNSTVSTSANGSSAAPTPNTASTASDASSSTLEGNKGVGKDEVGWYFVEQYYTTLSRTPDKLHLFYSKRSQFVSGVEAEKVSVSVGQRAINERIKELDIQDCKVRVSNVDSQESFKNIVVQVIGEMSNKASPHRKFVQTFVLAEQPNGYFVLNDIFRYIEEEMEEEDDNGGFTEQQTNVDEEPAEEIKTLPNSSDPVDQQHIVDQVDKKLEETATEGSNVNAESYSEPPTSNGNIATGAEPDTVVDKPVASASVSEDKGEEVPEHFQPAPIDDSILPEKPRDPDPTPVASPPKPAKAAPAQVSMPAAPQKPTAPKTWANLVASNRVAPPAVPSSASSTSPAPSQPKSAPSAPATIPPTSSSDDAAAQAQQSPGGWQTAGQDNGKRQGRQQSISGGLGEKETVLGYVKNVTDKVDASILKTTLQGYGKLAYFDVSRQKNCAFVEFADTAGYNAAVAANPHLIGGEQIYVEERRPRPTAYGGGFGGRGGARGGRGGLDGRTGNQGRGGFQKDGGRGGFVPRGRGGNMAPRGRGQPQAA